MPDFVSGRCRSSLFQSSRSPALACRTTKTLMRCLLSARGFEVERAKEGPISPVGEEVEGFVEGHPAHVVDLGSGAETAADHVHDPIARDFVATLVVGICRAAEG